MIPKGNVSKRTWTHEGRRHSAYAYTLTVVAADGTRRRYRKQFPTRAEAQQALDELREELKNPASKRDAAVEVLGLTWDRVDRARGVVLLEVTKSGRRREVPLNAAADGVLARRGPNDEGLVFRSSNWDRYRTAWERAVKRAKLPDLRFHDLRHTFASWAVQRRVTLYELKDLLGHSSLTMVKRYAHLAPEHLRAAAAAFDGILQGTSRPQEPQASGLECLPAS